MATSPPLDGIGSTISLPSEDDSFRYPLPSSTYLGPASRWRPSGRQHCAAPTSANTSFLFPLVYLPRDSLLWLPNIGPERGSVPPSPCLPGVVHCGKQGNRFAYTAPTSPCLPGVVHCGKHGHLFALHGCNVTLPTEDDSFRYPLPSSTYVAIPHRKSPLPPAQLLQAPLPRLR